MLLRVLVHSESGNKQQKENGEMARKTLTQRLKEADARIAELEQELQASREANEQQMQSHLEVLDRVYADHEQRVGRQREMYEELIRGLRESHNNELESLHHQHALEMATAEGAAGALRDVFSEAITTAVGGDNSAKREAAELAAFVRALRHGPLAHAEEGS